MEAAKNVIAKRYSAALFSVAQAAGVLKDVAADLTALKTIFQENQQYLKFVLPRVMPSKVKNIFLNTAISKLKLSQATHNFLRVLIKHNRIYAIDDIREAFFESLATHNNELKVLVTSAIEIPKSEREKLVAELKAIFNKEIILDLVVDEKVLGGLSVRVGSELLDNTLKNKLLKIKKLALRK